MDDAMIKLWQKIDQMPGGNKNPFEIPLGPTKECLTAEQAVSYVKDHSATLGLHRHLQTCEACRERIEQLKKVMK